MATLDRRSPVALHRQVADQLELHYMAGKEDGERLPTEQELASHFGVSRVTIRQALSNLEERQLIERKQGKGTFTKPARIHQDLHRLTGFQDSLAEHQIDFVTRLLDFGPREVSLAIERRLRLAVPEACYLKRQYLIDGRPLAVTEVYLPVSIVETVTREIAEANPSYDLLRDYGKVVIDQAEVTIRARQAENDLAGLLAVPPGSAILELDRLTFADTGDPCEQTTQYLRSDLYEFGLTIDGGLSLSASIRAIDQRTASSNASR